LVEIRVKEGIIGDKYNPFLVTGKADILLPAKRQPITVNCLKAIMLLSHAIFQ